MQKILPHLLNNLMPNHPKLAIIDLLKLDTFIHDFYSYSRKNFLTDHLIQ